MEKDKEFVPWRKPEEGELETAIELAEREGDQEKANQLKGLLEIFSS